MKKTILISLTLALAACARPAPPSPTVDPEVARLPLAVRLDREARARPTGTPRAEEVLAALTRGGLTLVRSRQVLASTIGASYCTSSVTQKGVGLAVCEYTAEDVARRGLDYSRATFDRLIPGRRLLVNRKTLLTVTRPGGDASTVAEANIAASIFAAL